MFYYNGQHVTNVRFYEYNGKSKVSFMIGAQTYYADADDLEKAPTPESVSQDVFVEDDTDKKEVVDVLEELQEEEETLEPEEELEVEADENELELDALFNEELVEPKTVTLYKGDELVAELELGSEEFDSFVKENKLDDDAIERMVKGEQKTHKGFSVDPQ